MDAEDYRIKKRAMRAILDHDLLVEVGGVEDSLSAKMVWFVLPTRHGFGVGFGPNGATDEEIEWAAKYSDEYLRAIYKAGREALFPPYHDGMGNAEGEFKGITTARRLELATERLPTDEKGRARKAKKEAEVTA